MGIASISSTKASAQLAILQQQSCDSNNVILASRIPCFNNVLGTGSVAEIIAPVESAFRLVIVVKRPNDS